MKKIFGLAIVVALFLTGWSCNWFKKTSTTPTPTASSTLIGGDRDEHGCIPSAGYSWCEKTQKCYRPWEEKCE